MWESAYWTKRSIARRRFIRGAVAGTAGLGAAALIGCSGDDDEESTPTEAASTATEASGGDGGDGGGGDGGNGGATARSFTDKYPDNYWRVDPATAARGGTMVYDQTDEAITLDNHREETPGSIHAAQPAYDQLFQRWEDWERFGGAVFSQPHLANSFEQVDDLTLVLNLEQGVHFHDVDPVNGREFVAEDVKYNLERMTGDDPSLRTRTAFAAFASIDTPDDYTVSITMEKPYASLVTNLGHTWNVMMARELAETDAIATRAVGTGPFIFKEWRHGVDVTYEANPNYWIQGMPFLDEFHLRWQPDSAAVTANFRTGETDYWGGSYSSTPPDVVESLYESVGGEEKVRRFQSEATGVTKIAFDTANEPFKDKRLRDAIKYGMNYQKIIDIFGGLAKRTGMMNLANLEWGLSSEELPSDIKTDGDPAEAAKLLGAAGYDADNHLQVKTSVAQYYSGPAVGQITQALLKPLNIDVDIEIQELGDWIANVYRAGSPYQMTTHADWTWEDPDRGLFSYFHSQGSQNNTHYNNPDVDRMLEEQRAEFDLETRQQIVKDIQLQVINDTPQAWLVAPGGLNFVRNRIKNLRRMIHGNSNFYRQWSTVWFGDPSSAG